MVVVAVVVLVVAVVVVVVVPFRPRALSLISAA